MVPTKEKYPIFQMNQVLTNRHLNDVFNYLDEQERLTRANLIGIGIVCGLEIRLNPATPAIEVSPGCGVTSEGYLVVWPRMRTFGRVRRYRLPGEVAYPPFIRSGDASFDLYELLERNEDGSHALTADDLDNKAVVLFVELLQEGLRNCSPNNCDDRGASVGVTVRPLLIGVDDLRTIIGRVGDEYGGWTAGEVLDRLDRELGLPDLRLPRYDVPNTRVVSSEDVLGGFYRAGHRLGIAGRVAGALNSAYAAFRPLLETPYPANPFHRFVADFGFFDQAPRTTQQARFLPYYYDFLADLLRAYDEFRWAAAELICGCCPPGSLFPRHLLLGELFPRGQTIHYRHPFLPSPAVGRCQDRADVVVQLFTRLVELTRQFVERPFGRLEQRQQDSIRITPSRYGDVPLAARCIPYYYKFDGTPALFELWSPEKTRRRRAAENLGYYAREYSSQPFVVRPLEYDLEPHDFLRIEGHLGQDVQVALRTLLELRTEYRLPVEIVALRTGVFDPRIKIDLRAEDCRLEDLEVQYAVLREEVRCFICGELQYFYQLPFNFRSENDAPYRPLEPLLRSCVPEFRVQPNTIGDLFEVYYDELMAPSVNTRLLSFNQRVIIEAGEAATPINTVFLYLAYLIRDLSQLAATLTPGLRDVDFTALAARYTALDEVARAAENALPETDSIAREAVADRIRAVRYACRREAFLALRDDLRRRVLELRKQQFLATFLGHHPGIQHAGGVPVGGTFILVYHQDRDAIEPDPVRPGRDVVDLTDVLTQDVAIGAAAAAGAAQVRLNAAATLFRSKDEINRALTGLYKDPAALANRDVQILISALTNQVPSADLLEHRRDWSEEVDKILRRTVGELANGTVIADFFLPYLCCSDCSPVQYVLPPVPLDVVLRVGCTDPASGKAPVTVTPQGGQQPFTVAVDGAEPTLLSGALQLAAGDHTVVVADALGAKSPERLATVYPALAVSAEKYVDDAAAGRYRVEFTVSGGQGDYTVSGGQVDKGAFTSDPVASGEQLEVTITDAAGCTLTRTFTHAVCTLPCGGRAVRYAYRLWLPAPTRTAQYKAYDVRDVEFRFEFPAGGEIDLSEFVAKVLPVKPEALNKDFDAAMADRIRMINREIASRTKSKDWLVLGYERAPLEAYGTLTIEYFECLDFRFGLDARFQRPEVRERMRIAYAPKSAVVEATDGDERLKFALPAAATVWIDKCDPGQPERPLCRLLTGQVTIDVKPGDGSYVLSAKTTAASRFTTYLWEVQDGLPAFSNKESEEFKFRNPEQPVKHVRLTAFTDLGCSTTATIDINLRER